MDNNTEKDTDVILEVKDLKTYFKTGPHKVVKAVEGVNFSLRKGKVLGIIGESGSGKSVTARSILRIVESPGYIAGGEIRFKGQDILKLPEKEMKSIRGNEISMIFQDPTTSFNPYMTIGAQLAEAYNAHTPSGSEKAKQEIMRVLKLVGITNGEEVIKKYPCEFSAGFRQRIFIAMSMILYPDLLIADEPTTALDVTIQAGIIELMNELRSKYNSSILMITHDFGIVADMADRVGVMYAGNIVEVADVFDIFDNASHPYTKLLMKALPTITKEEGRLETIKGTVPDLSLPIQGCKFADRCPTCREICRSEKPAMKEIRRGHFVACHCCEGGKAHE